MSLKAVMRLCDWHEMLTQTSGPGLPNNNPRWRQPPFWNQLNGHNSDIIAFICTKFDTVPENGPPEPDFPLVLTCEKIQDGGRLHFEISQTVINRPVLNGLTHKFQSPPGTSFPSILSSNKIQDGSGRNIEIRIYDHNLAAIALS